MRNFEPETLSLWLFLFAAEIRSSTIATKQGSLKKCSPCSDKKELVILESLWRTVLKNLVRLSSSLGALKAELTDYRKDLVAHLEEKDELFEAKRLKRLSCLKSLLEDFNRFISTFTPSITEVGYL